MKTVIYVALISALASITYRLYAAEKMTNLPVGAVRQ